MPLDLRRAIVTNWPMKVTSLAVAAVLWAVLAAQEDTTQFVPVNLNLTLPAGRTLTQEPPQVEALFNGPARELFKLFSAPPFIEADVPDVATTSYRLALSVRDLQYGTDAAVAVVDLRPRQIEVFLDSVISKSVPVVADVVIEADSGFQMLGSVTVTPPTVTVTGTEAEIDSVTGVRTVAYRASDVQGTLRETIALDTTGLSGIRLSRYDVDITAVIAEVTVRVLSNVRIALVGEESEAWIAAPSTILVSLNGPAPRVDAMTADSVQVTVRVTDQVDSATVNVSVRAPNGIRATPTPAQVVIRRRARV